MRMHTFGCNKPEHFIDLYADVLKNPKSILEIGVQTGKSLIMWRNAFPDAEVTGLDKDDVLETLPETITFVKGDHDDLETLNKLGNYDLIIDDGSHKTGSQQFMFDILFKHVNPGGQYVIEDLETSYMERFVNSPMSTVEFLKGLIDTMNNAEGDIKRLTFEEDIVVIEKR